MRKTLVAVALILAMTADSGIAVAQGAAPLDLKGRWVGTSESIVRGRALHHAPARGSRPLLDNVLFTYAITGQVGRRFWGTVSGRGDQEPLTGVIAYDDKTIIWQDSDGLVQGTIIDRNTLDLVYSHTGKSTVVAVIRVKRQK
jgi:hypothetical protein